MDGDGVIRTGIPGLDGILMGGIPTANLILVEGPTGSGKTLLGTEFIYRGITEFNQPGIIVVFEVSPDRLIRDAASLGWDLAELQAQRKLQIVCTSPQVLDQELRSANSLLLETAGEMGAQRIFIDGIGMLRQAAASAPASYREVLQQFIEGLSREHLTAMLSHEIGDSNEPPATLEAAECLVDTV